MRRAVARLESRGWVRGGGLTDQGRAGRLSIEQRTDDQEQAIATALGGRLDAWVIRRSVPRLSWQCAATTGSRWTSTLSAWRRVPTFPPPISPSSCAATTGTMSSAAFVSAHRPDVLCQATRLPLAA